MFDEDVDDEMSDLSTEIKSGVTDAIIDPVQKKKQQLRNALLELAKGNIKLGNFGTLSFDVDPIGKEKSASAELKIPLGKKKSR